MPVVLDAAEALVASLRESEAATGGWTSEDVDDHVHDALLSCLRQLEETGLHGVANQLPSNVVWKTANDYLKRGQLHLRARNKPRGYAGDFEMLRMICENYHCDDPLGRSFDRFFQAQHAPKAVRNRTRIIADRVVERARATSGDLKVISLGSGPGIDMQWAAEELGPEAQRLQVTLIDIDPDGLQHASQRLQPHLAPDSLHLYRTNLGRVSGNKKLLADIAGADLISCTGLMDYFQEDVAVELVAALSDCLATDGLMTIFNFSTDNPTRAYMEWIANWYLVYRTQEDMLRLGRCAGFAAEQLRVDAEETGVNLYLTAAK